MNAAAVMLPLLCAFLYAPAQKTPDKYVFRFTARSGITLYAVGKQTPDNRS